MLSFGSGLYVFHNSILPESEVFLKSILDRCEEMKALKIDACFEKPFSLKDICNKIEEWAAQN